MASSAMERRDDAAARRRRIIYTAVILGLVALAFYIGFIVSVGVK
jgi:hypothetical protein